MMPAELRNKVTIDRSTIESKNLCQFACLSKSAMRKSDAEGRRSGELPDYRSPFAHDADRIMHSHSYARYMDKTQVFFKSRMIILLVVLCMFKWYPVSLEQLDDA